MIIGYIVRAAAKSSAHDSKHSGGKSKEKEKSKKSKSSSSHAVTPPVPSVPLSQPSPAPAPASASAPAPAPAAAASMKSVAALVDQRGNHHYYVRTALRSTRTVQAYRHVHVLCIDMRLPAFSFRLEKKIPYHNRMSKSCHHV